MGTGLSEIRKAWPQPLTGTVNARTRDRVVDAFPVLSGCGHDAFLALGKYLDGTPERFYAADACRTYTDFLEDQMSSDSARLTRLLDEHADDIDRAILTLNEVCAEDWHDPETDNDEYAFIRLCNRWLHPSCLKLAEGVLHRFVFLPATCLRLDRGKSTEDLWRLSACVQELNRTPLKTLTTHCDSVVRNSIAHGRISYKQREVLYHDRDDKSRKRSDRSVVEMVDGLVDTCNGCALALKLFYRQHLGAFRVPQQVMLEELQADTETPWWHIEGCLVSEMTGKRRLVIYARPASRDYGKVQYMTVYTGILAEYFAPEFEQYEVSLRSPIAWPGGAVFDGKKLKEIRERPGPRSMEEYKGVLENNLVFYRPNVPQLKLVSKIETLLTSFRLHMPLAFEQIRESLERIPIKPRRAEIHRNGWGAVVNGAVVVDLSRESDPRDAVRKARRRIIRAARRLAYKRSTRCNVARFLPTGYARIAVYQSDQRHRALWGLPADLVCTVQIQFIARIRAPDISGSTIERVGIHRIAWNKAWLDAQPQ